MPSKTRSGTAWATSTSSSCTEERKLPRGVDPRDDWLLDFQLPHGANAWPAYLKLLLAHQAQWGQCLSASPNGTPISRTTSMMFVRSESALVLLPREAGDASI